MKKKPMKTGKVKPLSALDIAPANVQSTLPHDLDIIRAAEIFSVSEKTLRRWVADGCPHTRPVEKTGALLFNPTEVAHWLAAHPGHGQRGRPAESDSSILEWRRRKERALALQYELALDRERKILVLASDSAAREMAIILIFKSLFDSIESRAYELVGHGEDEIAIKVGKWRDEFYTLCASGRPPIEPPDGAAASEEPAAAADAPAAGPVDAAAGGGPGHE